MKLHAATTLPPYTAENPCRTYCGRSLYKHGVWTMIVVSGDAEEFTLRGRSPATPCCAQCRRSLEKLNARHP
jgi:hypothetical protein